MRFDVFAGWSVCCFKAACFCLVEMTIDCVLATFKDSLLPLSQLSKASRSSFRASLNREMLSALKLQLVSSAYV